MDSRQIQRDVRKIRWLTTGYEPASSEESGWTEMIRAGRVLREKLGAYGGSPSQDSGDPPSSYNPLVALEPTPYSEPAFQSVGEELAIRTLREQKQQVFEFLEECNLAKEIAELEAVEKRLFERSERDRQHAAFSARVLLRAIADQVFPSRTEPWVDRKGSRHEVGPEKVANRLAAFVDEHLGDDLEKGERRAFQADLDAVADWVGGGPHGVHSIFSAETAYRRLISTLAHVARAHRNQGKQETR